MCFKVFSLLLGVASCLSASQHPPKNFPLSTAPSKHMTGSSAEFGYWSINAFNDGVFAVGWPDNSQIPNLQLDLFVRSGVAKHDGHHGHHVKAKLNDPFIAFHSLNRQFSRQIATCVNPAMDGNVVVFAQVSDATLASTDPSARQIWRAVSYDHGKTFPLVSRLFGFPDLAVDTLAIADSFGNIWISYLSGPLSDPQLNPRSVVLAVSSDGGASFTQVTELIPPAGYPSGYDLPAMAFGGDGQGGQGLWFAPTLIDGDFNVTPTLGFIPVSGLGQYDVGQMQTVIYTSLLAYDWEPSLVVSKGGKVFLVSQESSAETQEGNDGVKFLSKLDGVNNLVDGNINGPTIIQQRYVAAYPTFPFQQPNVVLSVSPQAIVYNEKAKLLHVLFLDQLGPDSPDYALYLITSDDNGVTWGPRYLVSDNTTGTRGLHASLAIDTKSKGDLFASWWDSRNDPTGLTAELYGTLIPAKQVDVSSSSSSD